MVLGGAATLWGPFVGALLYVVIDSRTREAGTSGEGIVNKIFNEWLNFETSPATFILAVIIIVVIFVAPFGVVGLLKRIARYFVVIVPKAGRHARGGPCPRHRGQRRGRGGAGVLTGAASGVRSVPARRGHHAPTPPTAHLRGNTHDSTDVPDRGRLRRRVADRRRLRRRR